MRIITHLQFLHFCMQLGNLPDLGGPHVSTRSCMGYAPRRTLIDWVGVVWTGPSGMALTSCVEEPLASSFASDRSSSFLLTLSSSSASAVFSRNTSVHCNIHQNHNRNETRWRRVVAKSIYSWEVASAKSRMYAGLPSNTVAVANRLRWIISLHITFPSIPVPAAAGTCPVAACLTPRAWQLPSPFGDARL